MSKIPSIAMIPSGYKAGKLYSVLPTDGSGDLTVVRAGATPDFNATRVNSEGLIEGVLPNVPRLDYTDGGCPSLLVEPQSTNLLTYSEDFSNASYIKDALTITSNAINSPNNSLTADLLVPTASNAYHYLYKTTTVTSSTVYTFSVFVKKAGYNFIQLSFVNGTVTGGNPIFDLNLGTVISGNGIITALTNGWYKISATVTTTTTSLLSLISVRQSSGVSAFIGDTISGVYAWGAQLEALPYATSYIPTVASAVTRVAETVSPITLESNVGCTIIRDDFYQKILGQSPLKIDVLSNSKNITYFNEALDIEGLTSAVFLTDIKATVPFSIIIQGVGTIYWGDGTTTTYNSPSTNLTIDKTLSKPNSIVSFVGTLTYFQCTTTNININHTIDSLPSVLTFYRNEGQNTTSGLIDNLPSVLTYYSNAGQNTTSGNLANLPSGLTFYINIGQNTTSGNLANLPSSLTFYRNLGQNTTSGLIDNLPSSLTFYNNIGQNTTSGNLANLPSSLTFYSNLGQNQVNQYTAGRVWANNMRYVESKPATGFGLTSTMVDNLLIDLSVPTWVSEKTIDLRGNNSPRTSASDSAVAILVGKGVTVLTN